MLVEYHLTCDWACVNILICNLMLKAEVFDSSDLSILSSFFYFVIPFIAGNVRYGLKHTAGS